MFRGLALVAVLALAGCGGNSAKPANPNAKEVNPAGDIPDNQVFVRYAPPGGGYSVKVPEGWSRTASAGVTTFTDKLNSISMRSAAGGRLPSGHVSKVTRAGQTVTRITFLAAGKPNPVTGKTVQDAVEEYVYTHRGKRLYLTLGGPKAADNVDPWKLVSDSVRWGA